MASTRITAALRDHVVAGLMRHRFNIEELAITEAREAANKLEAERNRHGYELAFTADERKMLRAAPEGWFPTVSAVRVQVEGGTVEEIHFGDRQRVPFEVYDNRWSKIVAVVSPDHPYLSLDKQLDAAREDISNKESALKEQKRELKVRAIAVIESVTTVKRLLEVWPEVHDFLPEENAGPSGNLPTILIADLNTALGLTKEA